MAATTDRTYVREEVPVGCGLDFAAAANSLLGWIQSKPDEQRPPTLDGLPTPIPGDRDV